MERQRENGMAAGYIHNLYTFPFDGMASFTKKFPCKPFVYDAMRYN